MHAMNKGEIKLLRQREDERGESLEQKVEVNFRGSFIACVSYILFVW